MNQKNELVFRERTPNDQLRRTNTDFTLARNLGAGMTDEQAAGSAPVRSAINSRLADRNPPASGRPQRFVDPQVREHVQTAPTIRIV